MRHLFFLLFLSTSSSYLIAQEVPNIPEDGSRLSSTEMVDRIIEWDNEKVFRGLTFNMPFHAVKSKEDDQPLYLEEEPYYFTISVDLDFNLIEFADITYDFDKAGLYYITVEGYLADIDRAEAMVAVLSKEFTKRFGEPSLAEDGFLVWQAHDERSDYNYEVAVLDFSTPDDPGFILEMYALEERGATE